MKKHEAPKKRICVEYKGGELILPPGHIVFELNVKTGEVYECKLIKVMKPISQILKETFLPALFPKDKRERYVVPERGEDFLQLPASDLYKAKIKFKNLTKSIGIKVKI